MLKDMLNAAHRAELRKEEKKKEAPDFAQRETERKRLATANRNSERMQSAEHIARLCMGLYERVRHIFDGVAAATVSACENMLPVDGLNPDVPDEVLIIGSINAIATKIEFLSNTIEFKPTCTCNPGGNVRCCWLIEVALNGQPFGNETWEIDAYADKESTLMKSVRISDRTQRLTHSLEDDEFLEKLFAKAFLKR